MAFISVAGLASLGAEYTAAYWREIVADSGAEWAIALHFDDFTQPFGELRLLPGVADDVTRVVPWLDAAAADSGIPIYRPPFGIPFPLY